MIKVRREEGIAALLEDCIKINLNNFKRRYHNLLSQIMGKVIWRVSHTMKIQWNKIFQPF